MAMKTEPIYSHWLQNMYVIQLLGSIVIQTIQNQKASSQAEKNKIGPSLLHVLIFCVTYSGATSRNM